MSEIEPTARTTVRRLPDRGAYDRDTIHAIVDAALLCHVGVVAEGAPMVIPMIHARVGDTLYLHGSPGSRLMKTLRSGAEACVTITLLDGLVLARSALHHSVNYRSVVLLGRGRDVTDADEKWAAMEALVEHVVPGRWNDIRQPSELETKATAMAALPIEEASAKVRSGPPHDDPDDVAGPWWAGEVPLATRARPAVDAPDLRAGIARPQSVDAFLRTLTEP